ncbi:MAG: arginine--tRNA ligase, partial [Alistipes sp.]|nr:arginine--tRNA ligase [Alistipes sp.]
MNIEQHISTIVKGVVESLYGEVADSQIQLQKTRKEFEGDYTLVVFPLVKMARKSPEAVANEIGEKIVATAAEFSAFNVIKGFLNLSLAESFWQAR